MTSTTPVVTSTVAVPPDGDVTDGEVTDGEVVPVEPGTVSDGVSAVRFDDRENTVSIPAPKAATAANRAAAVAAASQRRGIDRPARWPGGPAASPGGIQPPGG